LSQNKSIVTLVRTNTHKDGQHHQQQQQQQHNNNKKIEEMKNLTVLSIWAVLAANDCQAWVPPNRATTPTIASTNFRQRSQFFSPQVHTSTTTIYATIEDDKTENVADVVLEEDSSKSIFAAIPYSELTIGVVKETFDGENRVSQTPDSVAGLVNAGFAVIVQSGGMYVFVSCRVVCFFWIIEYFLIIHCCFFFSFLNLFPL
jgi:hypothetical protein